MAGRKVSGAECSKLIAFLFSFLVAASFALEVRAQSEPTFQIANTYPGAGYPHLVATHLAVEEGNGTVLYIGGRFTYVGNIASRGIAKWDGRAWSGLGGGVGAWYVGGKVNAIAAYRGKIIAGGSFQDPDNPDMRNIAAWDGHVWSPLGSAGAMTIGGIRALCVVGDSLYASGSFTVNDTVYRLGKWDGLSWSIVEPNPNGQIECMTEHRGKLIVGGFFNTIGGTAFNRVAAFDGNSWSTLGSGFTNFVRDLVVYKDQLVVSGRLEGATTPTGTIAATWTGDSWAAIGISNNPYTEGSCMSVVDDQLYVFGSFPGLVAFGSNFAARWDGDSWMAISETGQNDQNITGIARIGERLIATRSANVTTPSGQQTNLTELVNGKWNAILNGMQSGPVAVFSTQGRLLGSFSKRLIPGGPIFYQLHECIGGEWKPFSVDLFDNKIIAVEMIDGDLFVGGQFKNVAGRAASNLAKWNGVGWSNAGAGLCHPTATGDLVNAIRKYQGRLVVGGVFSAGEVRGTTVVAQWDGTQWQPLAEGLVKISSGVRSLRVRGDRLIVGGSFRHPVDPRIMNIGTWDGVNWSSLDEGLPTTVVGIVEFRGELIAAISQNLVENTSVVQWTGTQWRAFGNTKVSSTLQSIEATDDYVLIRGNSSLYLSQHDRLDPYIDARGLAYSDGASWKPLGQGILNLDLPTYITPSSFAAHENVFWIAGNFHTTGEVVSPFIVKWGPP